MASQTDDSSQSLGFGHKLAPREHRVTAKHFVNQLFSVLFKKSHQGAMPMTRYLIPEFQWDFQTSVIGLLICCSTTCLRNYKYFMSLVNPVCMHDLLLLLRKY